MLSRAKHVTHKLRELGLTEFKSRQRDLIAVYNYLTGGFREDRDRLFSEAHSSRMRGNRHKLEHGKFQWEIRVVVLVLFTP